MGKELTREDYCVWVWAPSGFGSGRNHKEMLRRTKEVADQCNRHVDGEGQAEVHFSTNARCEYCGNNWTEDTESYNGGCCTQDYDNAPEADRIKVHGEQTQEDQPTIEELVMSNKDKS